MKSIKLPNYIYFLLYLMAAWIVFSQALHFDYFIFDDPVYIQQNTKVTTPTIDTFFGYWGESRMAVTYNYWQIISWLGGVKTPFAIRAVTIFLHALNAFLIMFALRGIFKKIVPIISKYKFDESNDYSLAFFLGGLIFLLHPVTVESIIWVSSSKHVLATFIALCSLLLYLSAIQEPNKDRAFYKRMGAFSLYVLSVFASPITFSLCFLFMVCDIAVLNRKAQELFLENLGYIILAVVIWNSYKGNKEFVSYESFTVGVASIFYNLKHYFFSIFLPYDLQFLYPITAKIIKANYLSGFNFISLLVVGFSLFFFIVFSITRNRFRIAALAFFIYIILIAPGLGFVKIQYQHISLVADRFSYFALISLSILFSFLYIYLKDKIFRKFSIKNSLFIILGLFSLLTFFQVSRWQNIETLFAGKDSYLWHAKRMTVYGYHLYLQKKYAEAEKIFLSISHKRLEARNHLIDLYHDWGDKNRIREFLNANYFEFDVVKSEVPNELLPRLSYLFTLAGDFTTAYKIIHHVKSNLDNYSQELLDKMKETEKEAYSKEPFSSFISLAEYFLGKKDYDKAFAFFVYAYPYADKLGKAVIASKVKYIKDMQSEVGKGKLNTSDQSKNDAENLIKSDKPIPFDRIKP